MKRQFVLSLLLLFVVAAWLSACSTSQTSDSHDEGQAYNNSTRQPGPPKGGNPANEEQDTKPASNDVSSQKKPESKESRVAVTDTVAKSKSEAGRGVHVRGDTAIAGAAVQEQLVEQEASSDRARLSVLQRAVAPNLMMAAPAGVAPGIEPQIRYPSEPLDRENYAHFDDNPVLRVAEKPVSTFSIDVDTGSYTNTRRILQEGRLPAKDVVRVEEFINYFNYDYPAPKNNTTPFNVVTEIGPTPWNAATHLLHIGIKGYEVPATSLPPANLVFLVDVSGSMQSPDKLPLLKKSLQLLTQKLRAEDKISLVVYAGASGVVLEPTSGADKATILSALESLSAGGSTNGAAGIRLAYLKAQQGFVNGGINRVILATDGDFNVGTTSFEALKNLAEEKRKTGVFLTTLGFGTGNYNDRLMEQLADVGNGNYAYIDSLMEAQKVLVSEMGSTLNTIAKDVKIQIEFNPAAVAEYRLIGYENRALRREDFNNDKVDAGEIGAGHTVTAIYEIALTGEKGQLTDPLRYGSKVAIDKPVENKAGELAFLRLRYKKTDSDTSILLETPVLQSQIITAMQHTSERFRFAASVAGFGQLLRGGRFTQQYSYSDVVSLAVNAKGIDRNGYRSEFLRLVELAHTLSGSAQVPGQKQAAN